MMNIAKFVLPFFLQLKTSKPNNTFDTLPGVLPRHLEVQLRVYFGLCPQQTPEQIVLGTHITHELLRLSKLALYQNLDS